MDNFSPRQLRGSFVSLVTVCFSASDIDTELTESNPWRLIRWKRLFVYSPQKYETWVEFSRIIGIRSTTARMSLNNRTDMGAASRNVRNVPIEVVIPSGSHYIGGGEMFVIWANPGLTRFGLSRKLLKMPECDKQSETQQVRCYETTGSVMRSIFCFGGIEQTAKFRQIIGAERFARMQDFNTMVFIPNPQWLTCCFCARLLTVFNWQRSYQNPRRLEIACSGFTTFQGTECEPE